jgi:ribosomal protein S18 acetylase RimI-like enzyme
VDYFGKYLSGLESLFDMGSIFLIAKCFSPYSSASGGLIPFPIAALQLLPFDSDDASDRPSKNLYLKDFIVRAAYRRMSIGSAMLTEAASFARQNNCDNIYLNINNKSNEESLSFYKKNGYSCIEYNDQLKALTEEHLPDRYSNYLILLKKLFKETTRG